MSSHAGIPVMKRLRRPVWIAGFALLGTYVGARSWYAYSYDEAIASFRAAQSEIQPESRPVPPPQARLDMSVDTSTWSTQRAARYQALLADPATPDALLRIPSVKLLVPVFDGTSETNLNRGAGRIEGTARIGAHGNLGIAAHRDGFFRVLKDVRVGDVLLIERMRTIEEYRVVSMSVVEPSDISVLDPTLTRSVTLVTCYPFYYVGSAPQRFIVRAEIVANDRRQASPPVGADESH